MQKFFTFLFLFLPLISFGQYWAPTGTVWHYEQINFSPPFLDDLIIYESIGDTLINGDTAKVINRTFMRINPVIGDTTITQETIIEKFDSNRVYFYHQPINDFRLVYDFNAVVGDSFPVFCRQSGTDSSVTVVVDSVSSLIVGSDTLKVQYVSSNDVNNICYIGGMIIERIGWTGYMFPQHSIADPPEGGPLRCYEDNVLGLYQHNNSISCDFITSVEGDNGSFLVFEIYPNPSNGIINFELIETENNITTQLSLFDITGKEILKTSFKTRAKKMDVSSYPKGIYFYQIKRGKERYSGKVVVQ